MTDIKPDFIIVGAMKGGTSTLAHLLEHQYNIVMAPGEVNFFDNDKNYSKGKIWYQQQFKSKDNNKIWGEKTATYHYDEKVPERIHKYNPNIKLIWILRNPIDRAYSNYWHRVKYGGELNSFEDAVINEMQGKQNNIWGLYLKRSLYAEQIMRFKQHFEADQMHIVVFEHLIRDMKVQLSSLLDYLGIKNDNPVIPVRKSKNVTYLPTSQKILKNSRRLFGKTIPFKIIRKMFEKKIPGYPKMNEQTRELLSTYFLESINELEDLSKLDLTTWKEQK
jgi:hypothetical protein